MKLNQLKFRKIAHTLFAISLCFDAKIVLLFFNFLIF